MLQQAALCLSQAGIFLFSKKNHCLRVFFRVGLALAERWRKGLFLSVLLGKTTLHTLI